jgi:tetratricopeptide (TPR) repeat protein
VSVNDVLTLIVAAAAVVVSVAAIITSDGIDKRATRSALTDLMLKISKRVAAYEEVSADKKFSAMREIETLVLQAEFLIQRLTTRRRRVLYPQSSVDATLAMALDTANDFWWSDKYWASAVKTAQGPFKVITTSYWGTALYYRGARKKARDVVDQALQELPSDNTDNCIAKGDACLTMAKWDKEQAVRWLDQARRSYESIPENDDRRQAYVSDGVALLSLQGVDYSDTNLGQADLARADLTGANLTRADLTGANLGNSNLTDAELHDAVLDGADLTGALIGPAAVPPQGWERDQDSGRLKQVNVPGGQ